MLRLDKLLIPMNLLDDFVMVVILVFQIGDPLLLSDLPGIAAGGGGGGGRVRSLGIVLVVAVIEEIEKVPRGGARRRGRRRGRLGNGKALLRRRRGRGYSDRIGIVGVGVRGILVRVKGGRGGLSNVHGLGTQRHLLVDNGRRGLVLHEIHMKMGRVMIWTGEVRSDRNRRGGLRGMVEKKEKEERKTR